MASSENNTWKEEYQERDKKSKGIAEPVQSSLMITLLDVIKDDRREEQTNRQTRLALLSGSVSIVL